MRWSTQLAYKRIFASNASDEKPRFELPSQLGRHLRGSGFRTRGVRGPLAGFGFGRRRMSHNLIEPSPEPLEYSSGSSGWNSTAVMLCDGELRGLSMPRVRAHFFGLPGVLCTGWPSTI